MKNIYKFILIWKFQYSKTFTLYLHFWCAIESYLLKVLQYVQSVTSAGDNAAMAVT